MLFLFCFATDTVTIDWNKEASRLMQTTNLNQRQLSFILTTGLLADNTSVFNEVFGSTLTWEQIQKFIKAMHWILTDIVKEGKRAITTLSRDHPNFEFFENMKLDPQHPLYEQYYAPLVQKLEDQN